MVMVMLRVAQLLQAEPGGRPHICRHWADICAKLFVAHPMISYGASQHYFRVSFGPRYRDIWPTSYRHGIETGILTSAHPYRRVSHSVERQTRTVPAHAVGQARWQFVHSIKFTVHQRSIMLAICWTVIDVSFSRHCWRSPIGIGQTESYSRQVNLTTV